MDLKEPQFTNAEVLEATGLDAPTLQTWANRRIVVPASEHPGRSYGQGGRRLYSGEDVIWLGIIKRITDFDLPVGFAVSLCDFGTIRDGLRRTGGRLPFIALVLVQHGAGKFEVVPVADAEEFRSKASSQVENGGIALVVPTRRAENEIHEKLTAILGRR